MTATKTVLRLTSLEINEVNRLLQSVADRLDKQEGWRGTPEFQADINLKSNKATNVATATADKDAVNLGQTTASITTATGTIFAGIGFSQLFESAQQTITSAGALTLAHGLGNKPILFSIVLKCLTAELGYSIGDESVIPWDINSGADNKWISLVPDATNLNIRYGSNASVFNLLDKTTGGNSATTNANWNLIVRAWA